jgi:cobalt-zinc-cadmium efflux system membrane fusion protein
MRYSTYAITVAVILFAGCGSRAKEDAVPRPTVDGETVAFQAGSPQLAALVSRPAIERSAAAITLNGRLTWDEDRTVRIYTPLTGRVSSILAKAGDHVGRGQTLAVMASPDLGQAQADARRAEGDFALAKQTLARVKDLHDHGVIAAKDLDSAQADYARAESELNRSRERLGLYGGGSNIDQTYSLKSPIAGTVVERDINPGQELRPDQMGAGVPALFVITDPSYLWAVLDAAEKDLANLKVGKQIDIRVPAYPDRAFPAKIAAVADFVDPATRTIKVRATLANSDRLLKGQMFVSATANSESGPVLQVPTNAVFFQGGRNYVFVDAGGGKFVRRAVKTGDSGGGTTSIVSGLTATEKVVTEGSLQLQTLVQPRRISQ